ncbi:MAG: hypothetical protein JOZ90_14310 [Alphaproteobacteria bacterium]|nr:hypothetical protein [Alphaproteobacteria bacterium]MBV9372526.1 hypothetical protein [Alphaproteobacteria bacterium]MBV9902245.1 hypothetical protein [Alphaproteobacteria bacterium]
MEAPVERIETQAFQLYSDPCRGPIAERELAEAAGVEPATLAYWYGDMETLYRASVFRVLARLEARLGPAPGGGGGSVRVAVAAQAERCAALFGSDSYRRLLYLVVRDGAVRPWLPKKHQARIFEKARLGLEQAIAAAGRAQGARLEIRATASRGFVRRLHEEIALPRLVPGLRAPTRRELRHLCDSATAAALAAVYSAGALARGLESLDHAALPLERAA